MVTFHCHVNLRWGILIDQQIIKPWFLLISPPNSSPGRRCNRTRPYKHGIIKGHGHHRSIHWVHLCYTHLLWCYSPEMRYLAVERFDLTNELFHHFSCVFSAEMWMGSQKTLKFRWLQIVRCFIPHLCWIWRLHHSSQHTWWISRISMLENASSHFGKDIHNLKNKHNMRRTWHSSYAKHSMYGLLTVAVWRTLVGTYARPLVCLGMYWFKWALSDKPTLKRQQNLLFLSLESLHVTLIWRNFLDKKIESRPREVK